jgi:leucine dehydrogenase
MLGVFDRFGEDEYEQIVHFSDRSTGLRAIVAIHSTRLGPALGGTRFHPYATEDDALVDVLRLAKGMTYKAAAAGLDLGGGKAVVIGDPRRDKTEALLRVYARYVDTLGGRYVTAEDVGTTQADMDLIRRETPNVTGVSEHLGGSGDPSAATAWGVFHAIKATLRHVDGSPEVKGRHVVVSGVGKVGTCLVRHLVEERAHVTIADVDATALERVQRDFDVDVVPVEKAHAVECDVFSPCALGAVLHAHTIPELRCRAVVGSANNQLAEPADAERLAAAGVVYAPDYIVNAGGIVNIAEELSPAGYLQARAWDRVRRIFDTTATVLQTASDEGITTAAAADRLAEARIAALGGVGHIRTFDLGRA